MILEAAEKEAEKSSTPAHRLLLRGRALGAVGEWFMAQSLFEDVALLDPAYAEGWAYLGEARQQTGAGDGQQELRKAASLDGNAQAVRGLTALYHRRRGEFDRAVRLITLAAREEPELAFWQVEWANTLAAKGELDTARAHYEEALALEPANLDNLYTFARFCLNYDMDLRGAGLPAARDGAARAPADPRWQDLLGSIFWRLGDGDLAERAFRRALESDPDFAPASLHLGQYFLDRGEHTQAFSHIQAAANQDEDQSVREMAERLLARFFNY
jgi:tetratricopeptide (TPR) repeat protein